MNNSDNSVGLTIETQTDKTIQNLNLVINKLDKTNSMLSKIASNTGFNKVNKDFQKTGSLLENINLKYDALSRSISKLASVGLASLFGKLGKETMKLIDSSSAYAENLNLMQVAFQDTRDEAESFVNGLSDIFGLDESVMTRQLGYYRQIGNALAIGNEYADLLGKNLLKMQLDMSSLYNLSFERSGEVLQASMAGQTKPIRGSTGADITQSTLQTDLDRLGIDRAVTDLSRAEKSILIYLSLERQLAASQGDLAKTINSTANQQKIFTEQTNRLSRAFGDVLTPAFTKVLPVANGFLMVIVELVEMFAKLVGFEIPEYDESSYGLPDYFDDVAESAKKANLSLRSFDKLNNIKTNDSGAGAGGIGGVDQRLLDALKEYDLKMDGIQNKATQIRDTIMKWLGFTKEVNKKTGEITWKYDTLGKSAKDIAKEIGANLGKKLTEFTNSLDWEKYGKTIANGLNIALSFVNSFIDSYSFVELGKGIGKRCNAEIENLDWNAFGKALTNKFKIMIDSLSGFIKTLDWGKVGKRFSDCINGALSNIDISKILDVIFELVTGVVTGLGNAITSLDWGKLIPTTPLIIGLKNLGSGLDIVKGGLNNLVSYISKNVKNSFGFLIESIKDSRRESKNLFRTLKDGTTIWSENLNGAEKLATGLVGATGVVAGLTLSYEAMKRIEEEGPTFGSVIQEIGGVLSSTLGAASIGSMFGPIGTAIGGVVGLVAGGISSVIGLLGDSRDPIMEEINTLNSEIEKLKTEAGNNLDEVFYKTDRVEKLKSQLSLLVDENGKLKGSYNEVNPKLQEINGLLGTEFQITGDTITQNGKKFNSFIDLSKGIDIYIKKLKTKSIIEAYESIQQDRIRLSADLLKKRNDKYDEIIKLYQEEVISGKYTEEEFAKRNKNKISELGKLDKQLKDNEIDMDNYYKGVSEALQGNHDKALEYMRSESDTAVREIKDISTEIESTWNNSSLFFLDLTEKTNNPYQCRIDLQPDSSKLESAIKKYANKQISIMTFDNKKYSVGEFKIKGYASGGFPEDGWFRASKGEYFGQFDDGTSYIANNKQITDGIRQATTNGMMDAFAMQMTKGNKQNINVTIVAEDNGLLNSIKFKEKDRDRQYGL